MTLVAIKWGNDETLFVTACAAHFGILDALAAAVAAVVAVVVVVDAAAAAQDGQEKVQQLFETVRQGAVATNQSLASPLARLLLFASYLEQMGQGLQAGVAMN